MILNSNQWTGFYSFHDMPVSFKTREEKKNTNCDVKSLSNRDLIQYPEGNEYFQKNYEKLWNIHNVFWFQWISVRPFWKNAFTIHYTLYHFQWKSMRMKIKTIPLRWSGGNNSKSSFTSFSSEFLFICLLSRFLGWWCCFFFIRSDLKLLLFIFNSLCIVHHIAHASETLELNENKRIENWNIRELWFVIYPRTEQKHRKQH